MTTACARSLRSLAPATPVPIRAHNRYNIDPKELIRIQREGRERGEDIVGFYHSHPDHPAQWSQTDLAEAHWFGCSYVITSVEKGKAVLTNSFELTGSDESDKKLVDEKIEVTSCYRANACALNLTRTMPRTCFCSRSHQGPCRNLAVNPLPILWHHV